MIGWIRMEAEGRNCCSQPIKCSNGVDDDAGCLIYFRKKSDNDVSTVLQLSRKTFNISCYPKRNRQELGLLRTFLLPERQLRQSELQEKCRAWGKRLYL